MLTKNKGSSMSLDGTPLQVTNIRGDLALVAAACPPSKPAVRERSRQALVPNQVEVAS